MANSEVHKMANVNVRENATVDFVIPWVNGADPKWLKKKQRFSKQALDEKSAPMRYRDMGTLRYALRSIEQHCPWYNHIYLITDDQYPDWLDYQSDKISIISHRKLFEHQDHLPVFNSHAIEMNLAHLQDLSEQFVYLNDDTIITQPLSPERFFVDNKPVDFLAHGWLPRNWLFKRLRGTSTYVSAINNNLRYINARFTPQALSRNAVYHPSYALRNKFSNWLMRNIWRRYVWLEHWHHPQPYLKSQIDAVYQTWHEAIDEVSSHRFRTHEDFNQYLYRYWHLANEQFHPRKDNDGMVLSIKDHDALIAGWERYRQQQDHICFLCLNDTGSYDDQEAERIINDLHRYLDTLLPAKASFELD